VAVEHANAPAVVGAVVVVAVGLMTTVAVSCNPMLSVTVSVAVAKPQAGGVTVAVAELAFCSISDGPLVCAQLYVVTDRPAAAAPLPCSCAICPATTLAGAFTPAIGRSAAFTAPCALAMPTPHVLPSSVQMHSACCRSLEPVGTWHTGGAIAAPTELCGYGNAPSFRRARIWHEFRFALAEAMSAAMPETTGAEKLVPRL